MNFYLIEPYNAYQKPPKKKHWTEILEEEQMYFKMIEEAKRAEEARLLSEKSAHQNNQNLSLPQYSPQESSQQTVQATAAGAGAGGGGWVSDEGYEAEEQADFTVSPSIGGGPLTVTFTNNTRTPGNDTFYWDFGSGSLTDTSETPADLTYTQTGSYTVRLDSTSSTGHMSTVSKTVTVIDPTLTAILTLSKTSGIAPYSSSVTMASTYNGYGTVSGLLNFGDGTTLPFTESLSVYHVYDTGSWTASLALTESAYSHTDEDLVNVSASGHTFTLGFTLTTSSTDAPSTASFTNTSVYNGTGTLTYTFDHGDGTALVDNFLDHGYEAAGPYTASLTGSESSYGQVKYYTQSFLLA